MLIGRHDYWPGYTPETIRTLDFDLWPALALGCDALQAKYAKDREELDRLNHRR